jgi:aryl-alcohol dehydrogenase-like predicted oxidoreductase
MPSQIKLGRSGLNVSRICFGTWQLSPRFWGKVPAEDVIAAARRAFELGVNFYDTAGAYGDGQAETVLGEALSVLPRDQIVIATKVYWHFYDDGHRHPDLSSAYVAQACEDACRRLRTDYLDLFQLHTFDPFTPLQETTAALDRLKQQGKIRCYGVSNFTVEQFRLARTFGPYVTHQPKYNLLDRQAEPDLLPYCSAEDIGVLVYSPLCHGLLSGKFAGTEKFTDLRASHPRFAGERFVKMATAVRGLAPMAKKYNLTICQLAYAATLAHSAIHCAIAGIKNRAQIEEAAGAMDVKLDREDYFKIRATLVD